MRDVLQVAGEIQAFMQDRDWQFAFIGGIANLAWGELRTTQDVDVALFTSFGSPPARASLAGSATAFRVVRKR